tara:strand:+ start:534 stop:914 length:381 start_codon:yes stop_codon:yes gene_type:complete
MPKKIKSVKKLRSSKPTLSGMTKEELESILLQEQQKEREPKIALHNAQLEIKALKEKLRHPTFHDLGKPHAFHPPETFLVNNELEVWEEVNNRMMQMELNNITSFFMTAVVSILCCVVVGLWVIWP